MKQTDLYYRAFREYREVTARERENQNQRRSIAASGAEADRLETVKNICTIDEEWVKEIEKGLVFVEKAIREERQFIRNDGEVVPIEKAKSTSRASVIHLAKHSDYITHLPDDPADDLIPDKIFLLEKNSDYAVYENRFLYMLLVYTRDFIKIRLDKIREARNTCHIDMHLQKDVKFGSRHIVYEATLTEDRRDKSVSSWDKKNLEIYDRIEMAEHWVQALLGTSLMDQVSKTPVIKPPITKTNVLKMNHNFKMAVALYEYLSSYVGDGYSMQEVRRSFTPFGADTADELAETVLLTSFLAYKNANNLEGDLKESFEAYKKQEAAERETELEARISRLRRRIAEDGVSPEEYMLALESRCRALEDSEKKLVAMREERDAARAELEGKEDEYSSMLHGVDLLVRETDEAKAKNTELCASFAAEKSAMLDELEAKKAEYRAEIEKEGEKYRKACDERVAEIMRECSRKIAEAEAKVEDANRRYDELDERKTMISAELHGLRKKCGYKTDGEDYTSKERLDELEKEYIAFIRFFNGEWKKTKKSIRKELLWRSKK